MTEKPETKATGVPFKSYIPTAVLLLAIGAATFWTFRWGVAAPPGAPSVDAASGLLLIIIGVLAGLLGGIIGTGGCSVMLPAIHFWLGYPASVAIGTTLFAVIFTAISGGYGHLVRRNLDTRAALWLGGAGILGVVVGSWLFTLLIEQSRTLGLILGLAFIWPAARMIWEGAGLQKTPRREGTTVAGAMTWLALFGFSIGILTGIVGLGGGYALVPGLIYLFGAPVYLTMGTSLATMIPLAVVGGGIKLVQGFVAVGAGLLLATGTIVGAQVGAAIIKRFKPATLKLIFGLYFLYVSVKFVAAYFGVAVW